MPRPGEETFMVALLVSTSIKSWSAFTSSPGLIKKVMTVASAMDSPNCGMMMGICFMFTFARGCAPQSRCCGLLAGGSTKDLGDRESACLLR